MCIIFCMLISSTLYLFYVHAHYEIYIYIEYGEETRDLFKVGCYVIQNMYTYRMCVTLVTLAPVPPCHLRISKVWLCTFYVPIVYIIISSGNSITNSICRLLAAALIYIIIEGALSSSPLPNSYFRTYFNF